MTPDERNITIVTKKVKKNVIPLAILRTGWYDKSTVYTFQRKSIIR